MTDKQATPHEAKQQRDRLPTAPDDESHELVTPDEQALWQRYLEQQARRSCPGCGETGDAVL